MPKENDKPKYGYKDRAKAEETLQLMEKLDLNQQKLTIRGLLGHVKRVHATAKGEEKKNITEAMTVFEDWLADNGGSSSNKNAKTDPNDKVETVPGLGYKDKEAAEKTLQILDGRDPDYQKLAVKGLIGSSKRVLGMTKSEDKIKAIKEGVSVLEAFLEKFDSENRSKLNLAYLAFDIIDSLPETENKLAAEFLEVYGGRAKGNYKHLRTLYPEEDDSLSWDIVRNKELYKSKEKISKDNLKLFTDDGAPTEIHLNMIYWAYSPQPEKVKSYADKLKKSSTPKAGEKRKSSAANSSSDDDDDDEDEDDEDEDSDESEEESPAKKRKSK